MEPAKLYSGRVRMPSGRKLVPGGGVGGLQPLRFPACSGWPRSTESTMILEIATLFTIDTLVELLSRVGKPVKLAVG